MKLLATGMQVGNSALSTSPSLVSCFPVLIILFCELFCTFSFCILEDWRLDLLETFIASDEGGSLPYELLYCYGPFSFLEKEMGF